MDLIDRQMVIDTEGLDAQIRCEMCRNPMHTDRGCDGNCKYDEKLYERLMQILSERMKPLSSVQPEIIRCKDCEWWERINDNIGYCHATKHCHYSSNWEISVHRRQRPNFYCADAERRTDER